MLSQSLIILIGLGSTLSLPLPKSSPSPTSMDNIAQLLEANLPNSDESQLFDECKELISYLESGDQSGKPEDEIPVSIEDVFRACEGREDDFKPIAPGFVGGFIPTAPPAPTIPPSVEDEDDDPSLISSSTGHIAPPPSPALPEEEDDSSSNSELAKSLSVIIGNALKKYARKCERKEEEEEDRRQRSHRPYFPGGLRFRNRRPFNTDRLERGEDPNPHTEILREVALWGSVAVCGVALLAMIIGLIVSCYYCMKEETVEQQPDAPGA